LPSFYRRLLKNFESASRIFRSLPKIPTEEDKKILKKLEQLKVNDPFNSLYDVKNRAPLISGIVPERIVIEVREYQKFHFLTYWYFWSYDRFLGDHENWEPVTLVYSSGKLIRVDARVHNALVSYIPVKEDTRIKVCFYKIGHTPAIKVKDRKTDIILDNLSDGLDEFRRKYLNLCYQFAEDNKWQPLPQPLLENKNAPLLDEIHWKKWGKHSIYVRI